HSVSPAGARISGRCTDGGVAQTPSCRRLQACATSNSERRPAPCTCSETRPAPSRFGTSRPAACSTAGTLAAPRRRRGGGTPSPKPSPRCHRGTSPSPWRRAPERGPARQQTMYRRRSENDEQVLDVVVVDRDGGVAVVGVVAEDRLAGGQRGAQALHRARAGAHAVAVAVGVEDDEAPARGVAVVAVVAVGGGEVAGGQRAGGAELAAAGDREAVAVLVDEAVRQRLELRRVVGGAVAAGGDEAGRQRARGAEGRRGAGAHAVA